MNPTCALLASAATVAALVGLAGLWGSSHNGLIRRA